MGYKVAAQQKEKAKQQAEILTQQQQLQQPGAVLIDEGKHKSAHYKITYTVSSECPEMPERIDIDKTGSPKQHYHLIIDKAQYDQEKLNNPKSPTPTEYTKAIWAFGEKEEREMVRGFTANFAALKKKRFPNE